jgi:prolyl 4-hydroxylase
MNPDASSLQRAAQLLEEGRTMEAVVIITGLARRGDADALFMLAEMRWRGGHVPQEVVEGRGFFQRAGEAGHFSGAISYTNLLASGIAGPRDWRTALQRLAVEARGDDARRRSLQVLERMTLTGEGDPVALPAGERLSTVLDVTLFRSAFTALECDYLRELVDGSFRPSFVFDAKGAPTRDTTRTSEECGIPWLMEDPAVHAVNRRLAALTGTSAEQGEPMLILRYEPGQQYRPHTDYVGLEHERVLTALVYLNEGYGGGETSFPKAGVTVKGRQGDVLVFRNTTVDGRPNPLSVHAGLPVTSGTKYLATRWIRRFRHVP